MKNPEFIVVLRPFTTISGNYIRFPFIAIKDNNGIVHFTDFGKYLTKNGAFNNDGNKIASFKYIRKFLQYAFFELGIRKLSDLTVGDIALYLEHYCMRTLPEDDDNVTRNRSTMMICRKTIMTFASNLCKNNVVSFKESDLYTTEVKRTRKGVKKVKTEAFPIPTAPTQSAPIFRDIPNNAFEIIYSHIRRYHPELLFLVSLGAFAGLRPSEACNVRRQDCEKYGPGMLFNINASGKVENITFDLTKELKLRSDGKYVGSIKKERMQSMPEMFIPALYGAYEEYMAYLEGKPRETEYGAMNINKQGRCYTYSSYYRQFTQIINEEIIPIFLESEDEDLVMFGRKLMTTKIAMHVFRHWFTVQLVLSGIDNPAVIMHYRGDKTPEAAITYIRNKSDIEKQYRKVNNNMFAYNQWAAERIYG